MSELIVQPGYWNSITSAQVESFLAGVGILLGLTQKRKEFLEQVHKNIHGRFHLDEHYRESRKILGSFPPDAVLHMIAKNANSDQKKQLKLWYTELLMLEPISEVNPLFKMLLPVLSNKINEF